MNRTAPSTLNFIDNRLAGLLREISEAIQDCDDPQQLRRFGISLHQLHHDARGRAWDLSPNKAHRTY